MHNGSRYVKFYCDCCDKPYKVFVKDDFSDYEDEQDDEDGL